MVPQLKQWVLCVTHAKLGVGKEGWGGWEQREIVRVGCISVCVKMSGTCCPSCNSMWQVLCMSDVRGRVGLERGGGEKGEPVRDGAISVCM